MSDQDNENKFNKELFLAEIILRLSSLENLLFEKKIITSAEYEVALKEVTAKVAEEMKKFFQEQENK